MAQESNKNVMWTIGIGVVLALILLGGFMVVNSNVKDATAKADTLDTKLNTAITSVNTAIAGIQVPEAPAVDTDAIDALCEATDGCNGWWDVDDNFLQNAAFNVVFNELTEDNNKDLYKAIKDDVKIDDNQDINNVDIYRKGDVKVNQKRWEVIIDATDDTVVSVDMVLEVEFYEDGSDTLKTKYFRVQATLSDIKDSGITGNPDVNIISIDKVSRDFVLP